MATRYCINCGQPLEGDVKFCPGCGVPVPPLQPEPQPEPQQAYGQYEPQPQPSYAQPQHETRKQPTEPKPTNYLIWAILCTIFCCLPFGIVSIVYAAKVDNLWNAGQYYEAQDASRKAKIWLLVGAIIGLVSLAINFVMIFTGASLAGISWSEFMNQFS
jgi:hypothetical protein